MISFALADEQELVRATLHDFARETAAPVARAADLADRLDAHVLQALWDLGLIQAQSNSEVRSRVTNHLVLEELGRGDAALAVVAASAMTYARLVAGYGSSAARAELEKLFAAGAPSLCAVAATEPGFGTNPLHPATTARMGGSKGGAVLTGTKTFVPDYAGSFLVTASGDDGVGAWTVTADAPGVVIEPFAGTLGLRGARLSQVRLEGVEVGPEARLAIDPQTLVADLTASTRAGAAAILCGLAGGVLDYAAPYAKERVVHGVPLAQKQVIAFMLADMHSNVEAMRWMGWRAAWELDAGRDATRQAQLAFTHAAQKAVKTADDGVQIFGGHGYVKEYPIEMWYRNACALAVLEGSAGL